jgi:hypothetical protein
LGKGTSTIHTATHHGQKETGSTLLELLLQLHGEFRRSLEPIRVTPLQAGVILFLRRHAEANVTDAAAVLEQSDLLGYTLINKKTIDYEFEGCDFDNEQCAVLTARPLVT